jgi:hypothetical protein
MAEETASTNQTDDQCMVCLSSFVEDESSQSTMWTCSCCGQKTHMLCIFQWTLRLSINAGRHFSSFTCPGCRTRHSIGQLPGFQQVASSSTTGTNTRFRSTSTSTAARLLQRTLGITAQETNEDEENTPSEDGSEDQDSEYEPSDATNAAWRFLVDTQRIYIDIDSLVLNINAS